MSAIAFAPSDPKKLLVSSWDKKVHQYDVTQGEANLIKSFEHRAPVLDVCYGADDNEAFTAGMDWAVNRYGFIHCDQLLSQRLPLISLPRLDLETGDLTTLSTHEAPVRCVAYSAEHGMPMPLN